MSAFSQLLGRRAKLELRRFAAPGAFLVVDRIGDRIGDRGGDGSGEAADTVVLLPGAEVPDGAKEGDLIDVFLTRDSEDRPLATTRTPKLARDEVAFLEVTSVTQFGAFVDWGLPKELLVPFAEQTRELLRGDWHPIGLFLDDTERLAGTMKVREMLRMHRRFVPGEWVAGQAWRDEPELGLFVILERRALGLLPRTEPHALSRGQEAQFRVGTVHGDGKVELSLRRLAHEEMATDAAAVLAVIARPGARRYGDRSSPEELRNAFGLSKKAWKRAASRLLKDGSVELDAEGYLRPRR